MARHRKPPFTMFGTVKRRWSMSKKEQVGTMSVKVYQNIAEGAFAQVHFVKDAMTDESLAGMKIIKL